MINHVFVTGAPGQFLDRMTGFDATLPPRRGLDRTSVAWLFALGIVLGVVLVVSSLSPLKDDVAWLLYVARRWMAGQRLYEDLVEVNPPLVIWIYAVPATIAQVLGIMPKLAANPFFAAILLGCAWWTADLLRGRAPLFERRAPVFAAIGILLLILPGVEFGQREHLLAAAVLPYLALFVRNIDGEPEPRLQGIAAGVLAGLGCALKPTYVLALVLVEVIGFLRGHRRFRVAPIAAIVATGLYGLSVLIFCPAFLDKAVPLALALYGGTDTPCLQILWQSRHLLTGEAVAILLCVTSSAFFGRKSPFLRHLLLTLTAFSLGATVVFVSQGKDWFYHRLPAMVTTILALGLWLSVVLPELVRRGRTVLARPYRLVPTACAIAALLMFAAADYERIRPWVVSAVEPNLSTEVKLERLLKRENAHTYIAFSEWIALGFPVVNDTGVTWASRFDSMWALKGEIWRARQDGTAPPAYPIRAMIARDFVANCPDIAVVDTRQEGINYVGVLISSDPDFARAWSHYHPIAHFDNLRVLKRDAGDCMATPLSPGLLVQSDPPPRRMALEQP
jgi:hypothetical protein